MRDEELALRGPTVGGHGAQTIVCGPEDDLIYGDLPPGVDAPRLEALTELRDAPDGVLRGPGRAVAATLDEGVLFYATGTDPGAGGLGVWTVNAEGAAELVFTQSARHYDDELLTGARGILAFERDGETLLLTGGFGASLSRIGPDGAPELLDTLPMGHDLDLWNPGAFAAFELGGTLHALAGEWTGSGMTLLRWDGIELTRAARYEDGGARRLNGVAAIATLEVAGETYAVTLSRRDEGLTVFRVGGDGLAVTDVRSWEDDETGYDFAGASGLVALSGAVRGAIYASGADGALVVYRLGADGRLTRIQTLPASSDLAHVRFDGRDYVIASDGGRELILRAVDPDGRLVEIERIDLGAGALTGGLGAAALEDAILMTVAREDADGHDIVRYRPEGDDVIRCGAGDDRAYGGPGADVLEGGPGDDVLFGEAGADRLDGGEGLDALDGGADGDVLRGGDGDDDMDGGAGDDALDGEAGDDVLLGGDGDDSLDGGEGADEIDGGAGDDALGGGPGDDALRGGAGDDSLDGGDGADSLQGGDGDDALAGGAGEDDLAGGRGADALLGEAGCDALSGGPGDDSLDGGAARDALRGDGGRDRLAGGGGSDVLDGGGGSDVLEGGGGRDTLSGGPRGDRLDGGGGADALHGGGGRDMLAGGGRADVLDGGGGRDALDGGAGRDVLDGGGGRDMLDGGRGRDRLTGGGGADVFLFEARAGRDVIEDFGAGRDRIAFDGPARGFEDLTIRQRGDNALVRADGAAALLRDVDADDLGPDDFLFL